MSSAQDPPTAGTGAALTFNSPLSDERAARLVRQLAASAPSDILDVGCGWAELLLSLLDAVPDARGRGLDVHAPDIDRARFAATQRGLGERVQLETKEAGGTLAAADVVVNIGAFQAFGDIPVALARLRDLVRPGGRLLFGCEYWEHVPTEAELAALWEGTSIEDCLLLPDLVDAAIAAGFRPLGTETVTRQEWEAYESGHMAPLEEWLAAHRIHPRADEVRAQLDQQRTIWLRGHRDLLGFAYLTLLPTRSSA
ncbi:SAM-dependent methyltransferase [Brachybacterium sacelli]|uniref:SAM-dependent methyltransferase n=1 Tax=Brachybacterium sacelli TaxID=173364 RepID=A0ABS4X751_9MICO|nr:class I SAM-dependent methyltransferase [Brachybacterium sacelli]MBP2384083.1 SAM-dependent methyltransferase [Brachybacterium sacelli]